jgi:transcriptional regulator with XRE-family HTH domain
VPPGKDYFTIFGHNVRAAREAAGLMQSEIAERAGLTQQRLSLIKAGQQDVTLRTIAALGAALGVDPASLLIE